jgi:hypothetical protein
MLGCGEFVGSRVVPAGVVLVKGFLSTSIIAVNLRFKGSKN